MNLHVRVPKSDKLWLKAQIGKRVFSSYGHGVGYCIEIMREVFNMREKQFLEMAKSADMGKTLNNIDSMILGADEGGKEKAK